MHTYLLPRSKLFGAIDETYQLIEAEIRSRGFDVPGLKIVRDVHGDYLKLDSVEGREFRLRTGRLQRDANGRWFDTADLYEVCINGMILRLLGDGMIHFYNYVGESWATDKKLFWDGIKENSKERGEPKLFLTYKGADSLFDPGITPGAVHSYLVSDTNGGRQWGANADEPEFYMTYAILEYMEDWLMQNVLVKIRQAASLS